VGATENSTGGLVDIDTLDDTDGVRARLWTTRVVEDDGPEGGGERESFVFLAIPVTFDFMRIGGELRPS
jgi:hypothetical protein